MLSFESFHHGKWTLLLAIRVTFFALCVGSGGRICAQMSSMQVTRRNGCLSFSCYQKLTCVHFAIVDQFFSVENLLLLFHDQAQSSRPFLKAFWKMVNMAPGIFGTSI
jgi:hypothetical protein